MSQFPVFSWHASGNMRSSIEAGSVLPWAGLVLVVVAIMLGVFRPPTQLFVFVLLLNYAMPTAVNMSVRFRFIAS